MKKYRGIVTASGDGLLYEVLQGILTRKDALETIRNVRLGVLPLGSGNGLAASILRDANVSDISDLMASAFLIARGASRDIDIAAIETSTSSVLYSFLCLEWALFADIDIESEWLRCCGAARFTFWGVWRIMCCLRRYHGTFSYLPEGRDGEKTEESDVSINIVHDDEEKDSKEEVVDDGDDKKSLIDRKILPPLTEPVRRKGKTLFRDERHFLFLSLSCARGGFLLSNKHLDHSLTHSLNRTGTIFMEHDGR